MNLRLVRFLSAILILSLLFMTSLATNVWASEGASLVGQSSPLQELLYDLSEELEEISDEISNTIKLVEEVNEAMSYASYRLASYEIRKENQIEVMHSQIKLIYEMGSGSLMEVLLYADSITEFLNAMEMIQAVTEHNRSMILELQETHDSIEKYKKEIEEREAELAATLERLGVQQERLEREAEEVAADLTNFNIKLSVIQGDISEADRLLNELNIDTRTMEITYEARLLAAIIHTEARGEPFVGQIAVGNVVLNRVNNHQFPDTIEEVIRQPGQFCPVREGTFDFVLSNGGYHQELRAALYVLNGQATVTSDMLFFNSLGFGTVRIANHWFRALA